uniref:Family with sequence similarity 227 member A n=1 Tax=Anolis carolinensis TaxID=28377 RepID=R4G9E6_ANOCA
MELINTESFVSPLKGFLTFPSETQGKKSNPLLCKLDDKPRLYVIGSIAKVNKKIANLEVGLKRYDSSDVVIDDAALKKHALQRGLKKGKGVSKIKEKDQKGTQKFGGYSSETVSPTSPGKIAHKKIIAETDKLVELFQYPGYSKEETTPLPNGVQLDDILEKVIQAQRKTSIAQTSWSLKMLRKFLSAPCIQAILLDSFWWQFLQLYHPNREIQGYLFERIAENYSRILLGCHKVSNQEHILIMPASSRGRSSITDLMEGERLAALSHAWRRSEMAPANSFPDASATFFAKSFWSFERRHASCWNSLGMAWSCRGRRSIYWVIFSQR